MFVHSGLSGIQVFAYMGLHACLSIVLCKCGGVVDVLSGVVMPTVGILTTNASLNTRTSIDD